jgi:hypothetical protein
VGFIDVQVRVKEESREIVKTWFPGSGVEEFVRSAEVEARRSPAAPCRSPATPAVGAGELGTRTEELIAIGASISSIRDTGEFADLMARNRLCGMADVAALFKRA